LTAAPAFAGHACQRRRAPSGSSPWPPRSAAAGVGSAPSPASAKSSAASASTCRRR